MTPTLARRTARMAPSPIREFLKLTERPGMLSLAGGLPAPETFPVQALREACDHVLAGQGARALQYAASEGLAELRAWIAQRLSSRGWQVEPSRVVITTGSQQALDILGRILVDEGAQVGVEQPTYLGALQAFAPYGPALCPWPQDDQGPLPLPAVDAVHPSVAAPAVAYLVANFQNPTGACVAAERRQAIGKALRGSATWLIEDDPYGELWFDAPPPPPVARWAPDRTVYLGSFSKTLAPGLRVGYAVLPEGDEPVVADLRARFVQAKQATDLHTASFNQAVLLHLLQGGLDIDAHLQSVRARYTAHRNAMAQALRTHWPAAAWSLPEGGMFFWVRAPQGCDAAAWLPRALAADVAFVPGHAFYGDAGAADGRALRLSFVTLSPREIDEAVRRLARCFSGGGGASC